MSKERYIFTNELRALLKRHCVSITAEDHYQGYPECGEDVKITIEFDDWRIKDIDAGTCIDQLSSLDKDS